MGGTLVDEGYAGRFTAAGMVLEDDRHGPQLCLAAVGCSSPPTCSGPDVVGWAWDDVPHAARSGSRWGSYRLTGRFDGAQFTLTEPATTLDDDPPPSPDPFDRPRNTPCPPPAGGWRPVDPAAATGAALQRLIEVAEADPDHSALWVDHNVPPGEGV